MPGKFSYIELSPKMLFTNQTAWFLNVRCVTNELQEQKIGLTWSDITENVQRTLKWLAIYEDYKM